MIEPKVKSFVPVRSSGARLLEVNALADRLKPLIRSLKLFFFFRFCGMTGTSAIELDWNGLDVRRFRRKIRESKPSRLRSFRAMIHRKTSYLGLGTI